MPILDRFSHMTHQIEAYNLLYKNKIVWWCFIACKGPKNSKNMPKIANIGIFLPFLGPLQAIKHHQTFFLIEEVLSFNLVGHMWKSDKNWLQYCLFNIANWKCARSRWIAYFENYFQKWSVW